MGINVSTAMGFENQNFLKETAKQLLKKSGAEDQKAAGIAKNISYSFSDGRNSGLNVYMASAQITLNNSLKETLRYLNAHANDRKKQYILGELWKKLGEYNEENYQSELIDLEINYNDENIFAA